MNKTKVKMIIIGTGFSGLTAAIRLKQAGETDFIMLERKDDLGGVWRDNTYPGCACDIESNLYSFSFAPNPKWERAFAQQPEIQQYLKEQSERFALKDHMRFNQNVTALTWQDETAEWLVETSSESFQAQFVIGAFGFLSDPKVPNIQGIERFTGNVFHSNQWRHDLDLTNKRVAVIGTGASAIQFIPEIQPNVAELHVFQRTAPWVFPKADRVIDDKTKKKYANYPFTQKVARWRAYFMREMRVPRLRNPQSLAEIETRARKHLEESIADPELRAKLTPNYQIGCKRILVSNNYYPALTQPNVTLINTGIQEITENGVIDAYGKETTVDTIIFGTGFQIDDAPFAKIIYGENHTSLAEVWRDSPKAYLGTTIAGFPNLFLLQGPNTGLSHSSVTTMIEAQVTHVLKALQHLNKRKGNAIQVTPAAQQTFIDEVDTAMQGSTWTEGGCASWYLDKNGRNFTLWPTYVHRFKYKAWRFKARDYQIK